MAKTKSTAVINPNMGLYLDRAPIALAPGMLQDGLNFRIKQGKLTNLNLGYSLFGITLNGPVVCIATLNLRNGLSELVLGSLTDLYSYSTSGGGTVRYISPVYATGTVSASGTAVTGSSTAWDTTPTGSQWANAKPGDEISFAANVVSPTATWYVIKTVNSATSITLETSAGTVSGGTSYTLRQKFTGALTDIWQYDTFVYASPQEEDQIFLTNGIDNVIRWNGTDDQVTLMTGFGATCKTLVQYSNMMIYLGLNDHGVDKPTDILNSDVSSPSAAGDAGTGLANQFRVSGSTDPIVTAKRIGSYLGIYCKQTIIMAYFTGDQLVFIFRVAVSGKGPVAARAVSVYPDHHQFVGADTLYSFDGTLARPYGTQVWREIIRTQDPTRIGNIYTVLDEQNGDQIWSVPSTTDPGSGTVTSPPAVAWSEHYLETMPSSAMSTTPKPWSKRSYQFTAAGFYARQSAFTWDQLTNNWQSYSFRWNDQFFAAAFPLILVGDINGVIYSLNGAQDAAGSPVTSFVKFGRRALSDGRQRALLSRIYPFVDQFSNMLTVTASFSDHALGPDTTVAPFSFDQSLPFGGHFVSVFRRGRYMEIQFGSQNSLQWQISGYDFDIRAGGNR